VVPDNQSKDGSFEDRWLCSSPQRKTQDILELPSRPGSQSSRCFSSSLAQEGFIPVSTVATDTKGFTSNSFDEIEGRGIDHPMVANPILVSDTVTNEASTTTTDIQDKKELDSSRLAVISNKWTSDGINQRTQEFFLKTNRYSIHRAYNGTWKKFSHWCQKQMPVQDPEDYNVSNVLGFLMEYNRLRAETLNGYRSAIASVYSQLHPNQPPLASQPENHKVFQNKKGY
jgi:hypothetical protein